MHSIHYLDLIRHLLGDPQGIHAKTIGHPSHKMAQTRTAALNQQMGLLPPPSFLEVSKGFCCVHDLREAFA